MAASGAGHIAKGKLVVRIRIPKTRKTRREGPRYVSQSTKGMMLAFTGASTVTDVVDLTPSDPRCVGSPLTCTIGLDLKTGNYAATIDTFDEAPVNGAIPVSAHVLSAANNVALKVTLGVANTFRVTLDGVAETIAVGGFPNAAAGTGFSNKSFTVTAKDAGGNIIVGTYSTPIVLTDNDPSGATTIATGGSDGPPAGELFSSSDAATISYSGLAILPVTISAAAGAARGSGIFSVQLPVFVADTFNNAVKEIAPNCFASGCVTTLGAGFNGPYGVAVDAAGNVFVADTGNSAVKKIPPGCYSAGCVTSPGGGFSGPYAVAADGSGNLFVADTGHGVVKKIPPGCYSAGCVTPLGGGFSNPYDVAVDAHGNVYVADAGANAVKEVPPGCVVAGCVTTLGGGFDEPGGVAVDGSGNVFVGDSLHGAVKEMPPGCVMASCVTKIGGGFFTPEAVRVDGVGDVFVADFGNTAVKEIPPGCTAAGCVTTLGGGFNLPEGVAVL